VKTHIKPPASRYAVASFTRQIVSGKFLQTAIFAVSFLTCAFLSIEGGYQFHLSHDHSALSCAELAMAVTASDEAMPYAVMPPPCKAPDEFGQPWRLKLVMLDMLGFLIFGTLCMREAKNMIFVAAHTD
jgi:hypothetical protein